MRSWSRKVTPQTFNLLGGEPAIHPDLPAFVGLVRKHWPRSIIRIATNGFLLHRHPTLPAELEKHGPSELVVSVHHGSPEYLSRLEPVRALLAGWQQAHPRVSFSYTPSAGRWTRRYLGEGADMKPFTDKNPRTSWDICPARTCAQLHDGKIWKCAPLAYLPMQAEKFGLGPEWDPYLAYKPLEPGSSSKEIAEFFGRKEENVCSMCSAKKRLFDLPLPYRSTGAPEMSAAGT
ncbi:radical SAM protein [Terrihabitans soli]|uniref:Radical SAM protein n=2 Tax=Terrihabitans soli TaxID=708113 RepID=A0A6S6QP78_9HYPH|nr:radical SAM protein [Terrihabitans soli]